MVGITHGEVDRGKLVGYSLGNALGLKLGIVVGFSYRNSVVKIEGCLMGESIGE